MCPGLAVGAGTTPAGARSSCSGWHHEVPEGCTAFGRGAAREVGTVVKSVDNCIEGTVDLFRNEATIEATCAELGTMAAAKFERLVNEQAAARDLYGMSAGYAVFDTRRLVVLGLAASAGRGVAVSKTGDPPVYVSMGTAGVG